MYPLHFLFIWTRDPLLWNHLETCTGSAYNYIQYTVIDKKDLFSSGPPEGGRRTFFSPSYLKKKWTDPKQFRSGGTRQYFQLWLKLSFGLR